jgi:hypothetical protein
LTTGDPSLDPKAKNPPSDDQFGSTLQPPSYNLTRLSAVLLIFHITPAENAIQSPEGENLGRSAVSTKGLCKMGRLPVPSEFMI